ncbi:MAG: methylenetetrahydrofolate--tRNA-(uracil(54)-C(5))-methyltransferase (FADH(2)-oxidizing) TrmFO [Fimbriimonas sp.]
MVNIVGAGFAGVEAAWALASRGVPVRLFEMRPTESTPAHTTGWFAELVCSNSLKSKQPDSPAGQLKTEMAALGSLVLEIAHAHSVPGGQALAVDRDAFGAAITERISSHPLIEVVASTFGPADAERLLASGEIVVLATGPLTTEPLSHWLANLTGRDHLYFYDAVSPTVDASSLDRSIVFAQSRYDKGEGDDYLNCPFDKEAYYAFVDALVAAERVPLHAFEAGGVRSGDGPELSPEKIKYFAGCTPIEAIADAGRDSLRFGNFKPVGLDDPRTGRRPYAALQLRPENREKTLYSLVACQNRLRFGEQKRVFQMVPGLEKAEFVRYGVIHRNTYIEAPRVLTSTLEMRDCPNLYVTGQLSGVEGYVESAAMGIYTGLAIYRKLNGLPEVFPPRATAYGSLLSHLQDETPREFAPMNINWGLLPDPEVEMRDKGRKRAFKIESALQGLSKWQGELLGG